MAPLVHRNMNATARSMKDLVHHIDDGGMLLDPPYQRGDVWTVEQRVNLVRSLLLGVPVAAIVLNRRGSNIAWARNEGDPGEVWYACIDGKQRLTTMHMWWSGHLAIPAVWLEDRMVADGAGRLVQCHDLSDIGRRYMDNRFIIPVAEAMLGSLAEEAEVYGLINSAGTAQTAEDLKRAQSYVPGVSL
jgi:hypothetical protein